MSERARILRNIIHFITLERLYIMAWMIFNTVMKHSSQEEDAASEGYHLGRGILTSHDCGAC
jgi:hypothetical protein